MANFVLINENGDVVNRIMYDGVTPYTPPSGTTLLDATDEVCIGWTYSNGSFSPPQDS